MWDSLRKITLSDSELLEMFRSECNSFSDIAHIAGVSRERIRQIYNERFRHILGTRKTGRDRIKVCTRKRRSLYAEHPTAKLTGNVAWLASVMAERVPHLALQPLIRFGPKGTKHTILNTRVRINGHLCRVARATRKFKPFRHCDASYWRCWSRARRGWTHLIVLTPDGTYIVPAGLLPPSSQIYLPVGAVRHEYNNIKPETDWLDYFERWDLLEKP